MKKQKQKQNEAALVAQQVIPETEQKPTYYVVVRDGLRVSDKDYLDPNDPEAIQERDFWAGIAKKHSWGEPVGIVKYDPKRHRVW